MLGLRIEQGGSVVQRQINSEENVRLSTSRASCDCKRWGKYVGEEYLLSNEVEVGKCFLSSKVTFYEVLLMTICFVNVQDKWELGNI